jgi:DNA-binding XRE family transcriptional regulator
VSSTFDTQGVTVSALSTIGERIVVARKARGMSQQDLGDKIGVTFQAVSKWETGASMPDIGLLSDLAKALDVSLDHLVNGTDDSAESAQSPKTQWGKLTGNITTDIHGDVGTIIGTVDADIYGDVHGDVVGQVRNIFGNVEGKVLGIVTGDITGYVQGNVIGRVEGRVKLGVRGKVHGTIVGDGINVEDMSARKRRG